MRLWHEALIPYLPRQQLLGLHREVCALRGNGWGKKHATVNYVFEHPYGWLWAYHKKVMREMQKRGYKVNLVWLDDGYRGKKCECWNSKESFDVFKSGSDRLFNESVRKISTIYPEHNDAYLQECLDNLESKGIHIEIK